MAHDSHLFRDALTSQGDLFRGSLAVGCLLFLVFIILLLLWPPLAILFLIFVLFLFIVK